MRGARAAAIIAISFLHLLLPVSASAYVPDAFTGWGTVVPRDGVATAPAWGWTAAASSWQARTRPRNQAVYLAPYAAGWMWSWTLQDGWSAMRSVDVAAAPGWLRPSASTTGVPDGITLSRHDGSLKVTVAGTVIDRMDIHGNVTIAAPNVTIRRSIIRGLRVDSSAGAALVTNYVAANGGLVIEDTTLTPEFPTYWHEGFKGQNSTLRRVEITGVVDAIGVHGDNVRVESSLLSGLRHYSNVPTNNDNQTHNDGIQLHLGSHTRIIGNTINGIAPGAAVMVTPNTGIAADIQIAWNWLGGGGCSVNVSEKNRGPVQQLSISNNRFIPGTTTVAGCAIILPAPTQAIATVSGNAWATDGRAVRVGDGIRTHPGT